MERYRAGAQGRERGSGGRDHEKGDPVSAAAGRRGRKAARAAAAAGSQEEVKRLRGATGRARTGLGWAEARAMGGLRGIRVGEARMPGPYTEGGASSSGVSWVHTGHGQWAKKDGKMAQGPRSGSKAKEGTASGDGHEEKGKKEHRWRIHGRRSAGSPAWRTRR